MIRAKNIIINSGYKSYKISEKFDFNIDAIHYGVMHLSKGLEYKSVAVMAVMKILFQIKKEWKE